MNTALEMRVAAQPLTLVATLAHELRQPLSAIESTAYYLAMVLPRGEKRAQEQASHLQRLVEHASWILSCAVHLEDDSPLAPEPLDVEELITQAVAAQAAEGHAPPRLDLSGKLPRVRLDPGRGRFLIENLLAMLGRASGDADPVHLRTSIAPGFVRQVMVELSLEIPSEVSAACSRVSPPVDTDSSSEALESRLGAGASLGIESARRIVESHGGSFQIDFDHGSGVRVRILLPAGASHAMLPCTVVV